MDKIKKILIILVIILFTGCTKTLKDKDNNLVKDEKTNQILTENIICRPTNKDVIELYQKNEVDLEKLPECKDFKLNDGKYEGLWNSFLIKPLTWVLIKLGNLVNNYAVSLILISILIRAILLPVTKSSALQSENLKKAQPEINAIEKKYQNKNDQESIQKKGMDLSAVYKKYNINPISSCLFAILQIPLFIGFLEAINRTPIIFEETFLGLKLGMAPSLAIKNGNYYYLILIVIIAITTYFSFKLNPAPSMNQESEKQSKIMNYVMLGFITLMSFSLSTAIGIYWIVSSAFTIFQNLMLKRGNKDGSV